MPPRGSALTIREEARISFSRQTWYNSSTRESRMSNLTLAVGLVVALCAYWFAGRRAGFSVVALWSAATAYFVMPPVYSFRVSDPSDLAALGLYGAIGLVAARITPTKRPPSNKLSVPGSEALDGLVDLKAIWADLCSSSGLGVCLKHRQVEVETSGLGKFRCSHPDAVRVLSDVLTAMLMDSQLRRVSFHTGRRPGVARLLVDAHRIWPPPLQRAITIGRCDEDCLPLDFRWGSHLNATRLDNGYSQTYQISFRRLP